MRVWLAPSQFAPHRGGVEELTLKIAQQLRAAGDEVLVVTNRHPADLPTHDEVGGVPVARVAFTAPGRHPKRLLHHHRSRPAVQRALDGLGPEPDVVHVVCPSTQLDPIARWAHRRGVPVVITSQGETAMDAGRLYQRSAWMRRVLRREAGRAAALTACSAWTATAAAEVAAPFVDAQVILNGVDADDWAGMAGPPEAPVVAAWGRHVPQKGLDLLLRAWPLVRSARPDAVLRIGGDGPDTPALTELAGPGVELLGSLDRAGVRALLESARVAVVPSRIEPFGIVAVEALAAGRGLVYAAGTGLAEAAGHCGRAADVASADDLAAAVLAELDSPVPSAAGRARADRLSWSNLVELYRATYQRAVAAPARSRGR